MDEDEQGRENHRLFVEVMERYLSMAEDQDHVPRGTAPAASSGRTPADPSRADAGAEDDSLGADAGAYQTLPWRKMASDLQWTVERVQTHAFLYYTALCEDRRDRKRRRRSRQPEERDEGSRKVAKPRSDQSKLASSAVADAASSVPASLETSRDHETRMSEPSAEYQRALTKREVMKIKPSIEASLEGRRQLPQFHDPLSYTIAQGTSGNASTNISSGVTGGVIAPTLAEYLLLLPQQAGGVPPPDSRRDATDGLRET
jgi:hypothetical protein